MPPEPSIEPSTPTVENARANGLPEGFPDELRPHGRIVARVLPTLTDDTPNAKAVSNASIANVIMAYPHKPLVTGLYEYAAWLAGQSATGRHRDVVSGWRNWLKRKPDLAGYEQLDAQGLPVTAGNGNGASRGGAGSMDEVTARRLASMDRLMAERGIA